MNEPTVPCEVCGTPTTFTGTKRCNNCWEIEHRLEEYLKNPAGQAFARSKMPLLDDWVDGHPDAWDYEAVLTANDAKVEWRDSVVDCDGNRTRLTCEWLHGWSLIWQHGAMFIGNTTEVIARKAAALFVSLWLRGVSASFADKLMNGFVVFLERQEANTAGVLGKVVRRVGCVPDYLHAYPGTFVEEDKLLRDAGYREGDEIGIIFRRPIRGS